MKNGRPEGRAFCGPIPRRRFSGHVYWEVGMGEDKASGSLPWIRVPFFKRLVWCELFIPEPLNSELLGARMAQWDRGEVPAQSILSRPSIDEILNGLAPVNFNISEMRHELEELKSTDFSSLAAADEADIHSRIQDAESLLTWFIPPDFRSFAFTWVMGIGVAQTIIDEEKEMKRAAKKAYRRHEEPSARVNGIVLDCVQSEFNEAARRLIGHGGRNGR